jgi:hypothetical protein
MNLSAYIVCVGSVKRVTCLKGILNDESAIMCMIIGRNKLIQYNTIQYRQLKQCIYVGEPGVQTWVTSCENHSSCSGNVSV